MSTVVHSEAGIEQLLHTETELLPPKSLVENARLKDYAAEYKSSVDDPEAFWAGAAKELEWFQPWTKVFDWKYPTFEWFQGGKCNITYNCLDRQVKSGRKNKVAYIWVGEDGTEQQITYSQLLGLCLPHRERTEIARREKGRPCHRLHAAVPGRRSLHAGLCADRRCALCCIRWLQRWRSAQPH